MRKGNLQKESKVLDMENIRTAASCSTLADDLKPTRTTFRLSNRCTECLRALASWIEITEKEVIDRYTEEIPEIIELMFANGAKFENSFDGKLADGKNTKRKTRVVSTKTLRTLDQLATEHAISRDVVLETIIILAATFTEELRKKRLEKLKTAREQMKDIIDRCRKKLNEISNLVKGTGILIQHVDRLLEDDLSDIESEIELYESVSLWPEEKGESEKDQRKEKG